MIELGGNINLAGFKDLEPGVLIVVKKVVGNYAKKISEQATEFQELTLTLKEVHKTEKNQKNELHGKLVTDKKVYSAEVTDFNLFYAMDKVLSKLLEEAKK